MENIIIIDQLNTEQIKQLHDLLKQMWWSNERTMEELNFMLKNCLSFGAIEQDTGNLVGYARVLTDEIRYAYIYDVMTTESYRGKGLGKLLMNTIIADPRLKRIKRFELTCMPEMMRYYEKFGFSENYGNTKPMRLSR